MVTQIQEESNYLQMSMDNMLFFALIRELKIENLKESIIDLKNFNDYFDNMLEEIKRVDWNRIFKIIIEKFRPNHKNKLDFSPEIFSSRILSLSKPFLNFLPYPIIIFVINS